MIRQLARRVLSCITSELSTPSVETTEVDPKFITDALPEVKRIPLDGTYYAPTKHEFRNIVSNDLSELMVYEKAKFDCENFAMYFAGLVGRDYGINTVGLVIDWSSAHAYNVVVYQDGSYEFYEPQSGTFFKEPDELHKLDNWVVVI